MAGVDRLASAQGRGQAVDREIACATIRRRSLAHTRLPVTSIKASEGLVEEWADQAPVDSHFNCPLRMGSGGMAASRGEETGGGR
jgi:hypothetical protein